MVYAKSAFQSVDNGNELVPHKLIMIDESCGQLSQGSIWPTVPTVLSR